MTIKPLLTVSILWISIIGGLPAWGARTINHEGVVRVNGQPFSGTGEFRFAFIDSVSEDVLWTNDGTAIESLGYPNSGVTVLVNDGLFSVPLGDDSLPNMTAIPVDVFESEDVVLRTWFTDGVNGVEQLEPDQPMTFSPYAFKALQSESSLDGIPSGFSILSDSSEAPFGFSPTGFKTKIGDTWTKKRAMPTPRWQAGSAVVDDKIYVIGGVTEFLPFVEETNVNEMYDPALDTWETRAPMPGKRSGCGVVVVNGLIYAIGGYDGVSAVATNQVYNPTTDEWLTRAPMPTPQAGPGAVAADGKIYVFGGSAIDKQLTGATWEYDPVTNSWMGKAEMDVPTRNHASTILRKSNITIGPVKANEKGGLFARDYVFALGGNSGEDPEDQRGFNQQYDPLENEWSQRYAFPYVAEYMAGVTLARRIYLFGYTYDSAKWVSANPVFMVFDDSIQTWNPFAPMPTSRRDPEVAVVDGKIYVIGGAWGSNLKDTVEEYTPAREMFVYVKD